MSVPWLSMQPSMTVMPPLTVTVPVNTMQPAPLMFTHIPLLIVVFVNVAGDV